MEKPLTESKKEKLRRAKKRVDELKGFYVHLMVYLVINVFILAILMVEGSQMGESGMTWYSFTTAIFWGIGLLIHAVVVFRLNPFFGKAWEARMIRKYMEEDRFEADKYKRQP
ncbi:MAG: 2TM domain-containing protein [Robiginitalea sp.]|jgi:hypothetical protein